MDTPKPPPSAAEATGSSHALARRPVPSTILIPAASDSTDHVPDEQGTGRTFSVAALWRFKWTVVLVTLVAAPLAVTAVWTVMVPVYRARALVHVRSKLHHLVEDGDESGALVVNQYDRYIQSQVQIISSSAIAERVRDRADVGHTAWCTQPARLADRLQGRQTSPFDRLAEELTVEPLRKTELFEISMATRVPVDAAIIVNAFVDEYMKYVNEQFADEDDKLLDELRKLEEELKSAIAFSEQAASEARRKLGTGSSADNLILQQRVRLDEMEGELAQVGLRINIVQSRLAEVSAEEGATSQPVVAAAVPDYRYTGDSEWQRLKAALDAAQQRLAAAALQFGSKHPVRVRGEQEVEFAQARLVEHQQALAERGVVGVGSAAATEGVLTQTSVVGLQRELHELELHRDVLRETVDRLTREFGANFETAETLRRETLALETKRERLGLVYKRQRELLEKGRVPPSIKVIARATPATKADNGEKRMKLSLAALFGAAALGLGCAYLRFRIDPTVSEPADLEKAVQGPRLGHLPFTPLQNGAVPTPEQAEAVRVMRTALLNRLAPAARGTVLQITSVDPGAGKSTVAVLLARSLAQLGRRVLLVDADLRRPALDHQFGIAEHPGLLGVLRGADDSECAPVPADQPTLRVLPAGQTAAGDEPELLANGQFTRLLETWRRDYEFTIVDGPPLGGVADAVILSRQVDGSVLVVRAGHCRRDALAEGLGMFSAAGGHLLGTVFVSGRRGTAYYQNGRYHGASAGNGVSFAEVAVAGDVVGQESTRPRGSAGRESPD